MRDSESEYIDDDSSASRLLLIGLASEEEKPVTPVLPEIDGYELLERLGSGGMGTVYKARQLSTQRIVALKILAPALAVDTEFVTRFQREATLIASLSHPHLVAALDAGECRAQHYLVMEYIEGCSLEELLQQLGRLDQSRALDIAITAAEALQYAHGLGLIHRDVKPGNILIDQAGEVWLTDLGLACAPGDKASALTQPGTLLGTPEFISPEQALGHAEIDARSDIYSLGATLFAMVSGQSPVPCRNMYEALRWHAAGKTSRLSEMNPEVSANLTSVVECAMAAAPEDRYASIDDFAADMRVVKTGQRPVLIPHRLSRSNTKNRRKAILLCGLALILIAGTISPWRIPFFSMLSANPEQIVNGNFEEGLTGWNVDAGLTVTVGENQGNTSSSALQILTRELPQDAAINQKLHLEKGHTYRLSLSLREHKQISGNGLAAAHLPDAGLQITIANGNSVSLRQEVSAKGSGTGAENVLWQRKTLTFTAQSDVADLTLQPTLIINRKSPDGSGGPLLLLLDRVREKVLPTLFLDDISLRETEPESPRVVK